VIKLVRFGGLSAVDYKELYRKGHFHAPPTRYGIYAFLHDYVDHFLWFWKLRDIKDPDSHTEEERKKWTNKQWRRLKRIFMYDGPVWVHHTDLFRGQRSGSWVKTTTQEFKKKFGKLKCRDMKALNQNEWLQLLPEAKDPWKHGLGGRMDMEHLEIFIEKTDLKGIK
jgi:hypothetical protein